jgi:DNA-binding transcriptional regulator YiaG
MDGARLNNSLSNLEYVTPAENRHHALVFGLRTPNVAAAVAAAASLKIKMSELDDDAVRAIRQARGLVTQQELARQYGVSCQHISAIQTGRKRSNVA